MPTAFLKLLWPLIVAALSVPNSAHAQSFSAADLYQMADRYCIGPDGDDDLTWALATHDGLSELRPEAFDELNLPGARQLRGRTTVRDGVEVRVLTARNKIFGGGGGDTYFRLCWVSAEPMDRGQVDREVRRETGIPGFRQDGARLYGWVPLPEGQRRVVGRREWQRRGQSIAREEGMRMILTNDYRGMTAITYLTPVVDCEDWCY